MMSEQRRDLLRSEPLTYGSVNMTKRPSPPPGFRAIYESTELPHGIGFEDAARRVMSWMIQRDAGVVVSASSDEIAAGVVADLKVTFGPFTLTGPVRVVRVTREARVVGFAYGTLPGHPEAGEEAFLLQQGRHETIFHIRAYSRPATRLAKSTQPIGTLIQRHITRKYLASLAML